MIFYSQKGESMGRSTVKYFLVAFLFVVVAAASGWAEEGQLTAESYSAPYTVGRGDILDIAVWKNQDLSKQLPVLPDGKISFPLIGEIVVAGKSISQISEELKNKLSQYIPEPVLSVSVHQVNSLLIYVIGKVNNPGMFALNTNVNALQALAMAKGMNTFAKKDEIKIFRQKDGKTVIFDFDYDDVSEGKNLDQNIQLERGDIIVVP